MKQLKKLVDPLTELQETIGMERVKQQILDQILFFLQGLNDKDEMLHTVITGPPGVGKTLLGAILGKIYKSLGILKNDVFKCVKRSDLVGEWLGHTAVKTRKVIESCSGGVMFIDEAYSLGNSEKRDSFAKECIDTLNQFLSEKRDFLCIIAGYRDSLETCFFAYNEGLRRRFPFRYEIDGYDSSELMKIFLLHIKKDKWFLESDRDDISESDRNSFLEKLQDFFITNHKAFPNYGGDIETLILQCKISHSRALHDKDNRKYLTIDDIELGFKIFLENRKNTSQVGNKYDHVSIYN